MAYVPDDYEDYIEFEEPGGRSALRKATSRNPRSHRCPTCLEPNLLTAQDVALGYQCNRCADAAEGRGGF